MGGQTEAARKPAREKNGRKSERPDPEGKGGSRFFETTDWGGGPLLPKEDANQVKNTRSE